MKLGIGVVGLGPAWDTRHRPALRALADRFEVKAICDPVRRRAEQAAPELDARACDSFRTVAFSEDVDAIMLLSAPWFGALPILAACDAGKAVYCGTALDLEGEEATKVRERVQQSGVAFMAEFPNRLAPPTLRLKELIATRLGKPRLLFCHQRTRADRAAKPRPLAGMRDLIAMIDWCRYVVGAEPTSLFGSAHLATPDAEQKDYVNLSLDFSKRGEVGSGPVAQISCGAYVSPHWRDADAFRRPADLQVVCENGIAFIDLPNTLVWFDDAGQHMEKLDHERPVGEQLLLQFHRACCSLVLKTASLEDAYHSLRIVNCAQRSVAAGERLEC